MVIREASELSNDARAAIRYGEIVIDDAGMMK